MHIGKKHHNVIDFVFIMLLPFFAIAHLTKNSLPNPLLKNNHFAKMILQ
jgi:hypothetical protein